MAYSNGQIPLSAMVSFGATWYLPLGAATRWQWVVDAALQKYGVRLRPTSGWTMYRPLSEQWRAWNARIAYLNGTGPFAAPAAYPSTSNHGTGNAVDVANWRDLAPGNEALAWARFTAICRLAGYVTGRVRGEQWHIVTDHDAFSAPAGSGSLAFPIPTTPISPEDDMNVRLVLYVPTNTLLLVDDLNMTIRDLGNKSDSRRSYYAAQPYSKATDADKVTPGVENWEAITRGYSYITKPNLTV